MLFVTFWLITTTFGLLLASVESTRNTNEYQLRAKLFTNYSKYVQPQPINTPVNVSFHIAFASIDNMDVKKEEISISIWQRQYWRDDRLKWEPFEYGNITQLGVQIDDLWTPFIYLYFSAGKIKRFGKHIPGSLPFGVTLHSNGALFFSQPTTIHAPCEVDVGFYPFDDQHCQLTFGTWSQDVSVVRMLLNEGGFDLAAYVTHNEWEIVSIKPSKQLVHLKSSKDSHAIIVYKIHLRRQALFYMINYILPSIVIAILSLLLFLIPPEVGKRMEAGINLLLCLSVYLMLVNSKMPLSSKSFPLLTKFYGCTIMILVVSLCCSCWVYSYYFMNPSGWDVYHLPALMQTIIFNCLGPALNWHCKRTSLISGSTPRRIVVNCHENQALDECHEDGNPLNLKELQGVETSKIHQSDSESQRDVDGTDSVNRIEATETEVDSRREKGPSEDMCAVSRGEGATKKSSKLIRRAIAVQRVTKSSDEQIKTSSNNQGTSVSELTMEAAVPSSSLFNRNKNLFYIAESYQKNDQKLYNKERWKSAAIILDRFFIILLVISIVASFLACFLSSPRVRMGLI